MPTPQGRNKGNVRLITCSVGSHSINLDNRWHNEMLVQHPAFGISLCAERSILCEVGSSQHVKVFDLSFLESPREYSDNTTQTYVFATFVGGLAPNT